MTEMESGKKKNETTPEQQERILEMQKLRHEILERRKRRVRTIQERHC